MCVGGGSLPPPLWASRGAKAQECPQGGGCEDIVRKILGQRCTRRNSVSILKPGQPLIPVSVVYVCVCVCVDDASVASCLLEVKERERERERDGKREMRQTDGAFFFPKLLGVTPSRSLCVASPLITSCVTCVTYMAI